MDGWMGNEYGSRLTYWPCVYRHVGTAGQRARQKEWLSGQSGHTGWAVRSSVCVRMHVWIQVQGWNEWIGKVSTCGRQAGRQAGIM